MKLFILGATGGIGRHLVRLALERGHFVTAYVRSPKKIGEVHERLKVMQGDVFNAGKMAGSMEGHDTVLSSFGPNALLSSTAVIALGRCFAPKVPVLAWPLQKLRPRSSIISNKVWFITGLLLPRLMAKR